MNCIVQIRAWMVPGHAHLRSRYALELNAMARKVRRIAGDDVADSICKLTPDQIFDRLIVTQARPELRVSRRAPKEQYVDVHAREVDDSRADEAAEVPAFVRAPAYKWKFKDELNKPAARQ